MMVLPRSMSRSTKVAHAGGLPPVQMVWARKKCISSCLGTLRYSKSPRQPGDGAAETEDLQEARRGSSGFPAQETSTTCVPGQAGIVLCGSSYDWRRPGWQCFHRQSFPAAACPHPEGCLWAMQENRASPSLIIRITCGLDYTPLSWRLTGKK